mgnify:CR=1 FL=1
MNKVYLIPAEIKTSPKEHLNSLFLNKANILSFLTSEEDIWKSAQWFGARPQYLYFTNGPVKANDWYIFNNQVDEVKIGQATDTNTWRGENSSFYEKIVATTNKDLWYKEESVCEYCADTKEYNPYVFCSKCDNGKVRNIPRVDLPFIIDFIKQYNSGNVIREVEDRLYTRFELYSAIYQTSEYFCTNHEKLGSMTKPEFDQWFNQTFPINFKF